MTDAPTGMARETTTPTPTTTRRGRAFFDTRPTETRRSFKTSEFWVFLLVAAGVIIAAYGDDNDSLTHWRGWLLFCATGISYIISRGISKAGSSEPRIERVELD